MTADGKPVRSGRPDAVSREIGSEFEWIDPSLLDGKGDQLPWDENGVTYLQSGRQVMHAVAQLLWNRGYRDVLLPGFLCESMLEPFQSLPWQLHYVRYDRSLRPIVASMEELLHGRQSTTVVLAANYFGNQWADDFCRSLEEARADGAFVFEDATHSSFSAPHSVANTSFASLRKTLPVPDGAYVCGELTAQVRALAKPPVPHRRHIIMKQKRRLVDLGESSQSLLHDFRSANARLESRLEPHLASPESLDVMRRLDFAEMSARREQNDRVLRSEIEAYGGLEIVAPGLGVIPSHLVVRASNARRVQAALAAKQIYAPIHWPRPRNMTWAEWPEDLISLPIDHRYTESDMRRVASELRRVQK
ncbi:hypothetical protein FB385_2544 [Paramicrobacterium agarici]|nr:hypothetical protein FB385_2544 [Microbacterium agarici]